MKRNISMGITILIVLLNLQSAMAYTYYTDILDHWGEPYIEWATNEVSLFQGYSDDTFKPENHITRAEFISIVNRLLKAQQLNLGKKDPNFQLDYKDLVKNFWAYEDIQEMAQYIEHITSKKVELKSIFPGNNFTANTPITRYEAGVLVSLITPPSIKELNKGYKDLSNSLRFYDEIIELTNKGIVQGYSDGTFRPWNNITRAEAAKIIRNAYEELNYLKTDPLHIRDLKNFNLVEKRPLFEYGTSRISRDTQLDKRFIDAITTLDYISFVGYIPYSERHLYDADPIGSLWDLKNNDYYNLMGANYYLLRYDKSLVRERKVELIKEALEHYEVIGSTKNMEGLAKLVELSRTILDAKDLISFLEQNFSEIQNNNERILIGTVLAEEYVDHSQYSKALDINKDLPSLTNHIEVKTHIVLNSGYLTYKNRGTKAAIEYLNKAWKDIEQHPDYRQYEEEISFLFTSMIRHLMMK